MTVVDPFLTETRLPFVAILGARNGYVQLAPSQAQERYQHLNGHVLRVALDWCRRLEAIGAHRVYWVTLSEMVRHLHIHLYPRWEEDGPKGIALFEARDEDPQPVWTEDVIAELKRWAYKHDVHLINPQQLDKKPAMIADSSPSSLPGEEEEAQAQSVMEEPSARSTVELERTVQAPEAAESQPVIIPVSKVVAAIPIATLAAGVVSTNQTQQDPAVELPVDTALTPTIQEADQRPDTLERLTTLLGLKDSPPPDQTTDQIDLSSPPEIATEPEVLELAPSLMDELSPKPTFNEDAFPKEAVPSAETIAAAVSPKQAETPSIDTSVAQPEMKNGSGKPLSQETRLPVIPVALTAHFQQHPAAAQAMLDSDRGGISYPVWMMTQWRQQLQGLSS